MSKLTLRRCILIYDYIWLFCTLALFQFGFWLNIFTYSLWIQTTAVIDEEELYTIKRYSSGGFDIKQASVKYVIDGKNHYSNVFMSYKDKVGDEIEIAVLKSDHSKAIRYRILPLSPAVTDMNYIFLIIILINYFFSFRARLKERKAGSVISITTEEYEKDNQNKAK